MLENLPLWVQIAEIISAVAVILSLIYLGFQVNDSSNATRTSALNAAAESVQGWYLAVGTNPETSRLFFNGMRNPEGLDEDERRQFILLVHAAFLGFQSTYLMAQQGTLDVDVQKSITNSIIAGSDAPGFQVYWSDRKDYFDPRFRQYVEDLTALEESGGTGLYR